MTNEALVAERLEMEENQTQAPSPVLYKFTNKAEAPHMENVLAMFYQGVYDNQLGIMEAFNLDTEQEELILVGVAPDENGKPVCFPIAAVLRAEDVAKYLAPNGKGGWFDPQSPSEAAEAREGMKPIADAIVEYDEPETAEER